MSCSFLSATAAQILLPDRQTLLVQYNALLPLQLLLLVAPRAVDPLVQEQITASSEWVPRTGATNLNFGGVSKRTYQME
jgi:hypothetical protein